MSLVLVASVAWFPTTAIAQLVPSGGAITEFPMSDSTFKVCDNGDPTKCVQLEASGISTATVRTLTVPNASSTICVAGADCSWTVAQTIGNNVIYQLGAGSTSTNATLVASTAQTPDGPVFGTGDVSNNIIIAEGADRNFDFNNGACAGAACANPGLEIVPATTSTTQYNQQFYFGNVGRATKTLTETTATNAFQVSIASGAGTGGTVDFTVFAADATDQQTLSGTLQFSGVNKAGTETCATPTAEGTPLNSVSTGTLTCTFTADTSPTNACNIQFNCTSSLTQTTLDLYYRVNLVGPGQVTPQ